MRKGIDAKFYRRQLSATEKKEAGRDGDDAAAARLAQAAQRARDANAAVDVHTNEASSLLTQVHRAPLLSPHNFCFVSVADTELYHSSRLRCRAFTGLRQDCFHLKRSIWPS